jgi:septal ring factor EnvC (AmiA/AmiB activator)
MSDGREHHHILTKKCLLATKMKLSATEDQLVATEAEMSSTKDHLMDTEKQLTATEGKIVELKLTVERVARQLLMLQGLTQPPNMQ